MMLKNRLIKISILDDNTYSVLEADRDSLVRIARFLSVEVPNAKFTFAYKNGSWDGIAKFVSANGKFLTGFVPAVCRFCIRKLKAMPKIDDYRSNPVHCRSVSVSQIGKLTLRDYQIDAVRKSVSKRIRLEKYNEFRFCRGIISAATNAGKSLIAAGIIKTLNVDTLILCHKIEIMKQFYDWYSDYFDDEIGIIDRTNYNLQKVTIGLITTLAARRNTPEVKSILDSFDCLIIDEAQHAHAETWSDVIQKSSAYYKYGLSGTALKSSVEKNMKLIGLFGPVLCKIKNKELVDQGYSSKPKVNFINYKDIDLAKHKKIIKFNEAIGKIRGQLNHIIDMGVSNSLSRKIKNIVREKYQLQYLLGIIKNKRRNKIICKIVSRAYADGETILILVKELSHGKLLKKKIIEELEIDPKKMRYIDGNSSHKKRLSVKLKLSKRKLNIVISTLIWKEGIDIPSIDCLLLAYGGKAAHTVLQSFGRGLRLDKKNSKVKIYDFFDTSCDTLKGHSKYRYNLFIEDEFKPMKKDYREI